MVWGGEARAGDVTARALCSTGGRQRRAVARRALATRRLGQAALCGVNGGSGRVAWPCGARARVARRGVQRAGAAAWRVRPGSVWACGRSGERARRRAAQQRARGGERGGAGAGREIGGGARPSGAERAGSGEGWRGRAVRQRRREGERKRKEEKEKGKWEREKEKEGEREKEERGREIRAGIAARGRPRAAPGMCARSGATRGSRVNRGVGYGCRGRVIRESGDRAEKSGVNRAQR